MTPTGPVGLIFLIVNSLVREHFIESLPNLRLVHMSYRFLLLLRVNYFRLSVIVSAEYIKDPKFRLDSLLPFLLLKGKMSLLKDQRQ